MARKIVVVDDRLDVLEDLAEVLRMEGYTVIAYTSPLEAITNLQTDAPDIFITDLLMAEVHGLELIKFVKTNHPQIHVVVITALPDTENDARDSGADLFIMKPFHINELFASIEAI